MKKREESREIKLKQKKYQAYRKEEKGGTKEDRMKGESKRHVGARHVSSQ
jgi:hypothetical protein